MSWVEIYRELVKFLDTHDKDRKFKFRDEIANRFSSLRERFRDSFIRCYLGGEIRTASSWVRHFKLELTALQEELDVRGVMLSKEFKSFVENPVSHLKKKIFYYTYDLLRGKLSLEEFEKTASAAIRTSLRTNLRNLYQCWVLVALLRMLGKLGAKFVFPEHGYLLLERSGRQKAGEIPPNCIVYVEGRGSLSFFLEAPRPIGWEDSEDLKKAWSLYTALRPDIMVYSGRILNIVNLKENPPVRRPNVIIECKELRDWYIRVREVRGPFAKPLTAEEWRSKWIEGLWDGLADILGVKRSEVTRVVEERKVLRLRDLQIVTLYRSLYNPDKMFLISRTRVPSDVRSYLENHDIIVIDSVKFNSYALKALAEELINTATKESPIELIEVKGDIIKLLTTLEARIRDLGLKASRSEILVAALSLALRQPEEYLKTLHELLKGNTS